MLTEIFLDVVEKHLNNFILLDNQTPKRLEKLVAKIAKIEFKNTGASFYLHFSSEKIYLLHSTSAIPDVILSATPLTFLRVWQKNIYEKTTLDKELNIEGDIEIAQQINQLFQELAIDWETQFAKCFGDTIAHHMSQTAHSIKTWLNNTKETITKNVSEYLQEEKQFLPTKLEMTDFFSDVDRLRDDVERAEICLKGLEEQINKNKVQG